MALIRKARKKGATYPEIAEAIDVSISSVYRWDLGPDYEGGCTPSRPISRRLSPVLANWISSEETLV